MRSEFLDITMSFITKLGNGGLIWIFAALILIITKKYRADGIAVSAALIMCLLIGNITLKPLIARVRLCDINTAVELLIARPKDYSFPSGHTLSSFSAATVIFLRYRRLGIIALILAAVIAFSRLYLYVHYPSDVICGVVIGIAIGVFARKIIDKYYSHINLYRGGT